jgi:hypothetical protein
MMLRCRNLKDAAIAVNRRGVPTQGKMGARPPSWAAEGQRGYQGRNGDPRAQYDSIFNKLLKLPDETLAAASLRAASCRGATWRIRRLRRSFSSASLSCRSAASRTGVPSSSVTRRHAGPQDDCSGRPNPFLDAGSPAPFASAGPPAVDRLGLTNNPRIKHCRASHLAACGHTVLPKIGPVIALRRQTDYQFSPNWLSGAEDELSQPRFR